MKSLEVHVVRSDMHNGLAFAGFINFRDWPKLDDVDRQIIAPIYKVKDEHRRTGYLP